MPECEDHRTCSSAARDPAIAAPPTAPADSSVPSILKSPVHLHRREQEPTRIAAVSAGLKSLEEIRRTEERRTEEKRTTASDALLVTSRYTRADWNTTILLWTKFA